MDYRRKLNLIIKSGDEFYFGHLAHRATPPFCGYMFILHLSQEYVFNLNVILHQTSMS